jgi:hypothetical protein
VVAPVSEAAAEGDREDGGDVPLEGEGETSNGEASAEPEPEVPSGQALLAIQNSFEHPIRFTLSPDEYDLQPGQKIFVAVNPGQVAFTVSSAWRGLSGNKDFIVEPDQKLELFLYFIPDPGDDDEWVLRYE